MPTLQALRIKILPMVPIKPAYLEMARKPYIFGFTPNPTLMRKAGVVDYRAFAHEVIGAIPNRPISFEVFSDEFAEMERQAYEIASWGDNVLSRCIAGWVHAVSVAHLWRLFAHLYLPWYTSPAYTMLFALSQLHGYRRIAAWLCIGRIAQGELLHA